MNSSEMNLRSPPRNQDRQSRHDYSDYDYKHRKSPHQADRSRKGKHHVLNDFSSKKDCEPRNSQLRKHTLTTYEYEELFNGDARGQSSKAPELNKGTGKNSDQPREDYTQTRQREQRRSRSRSLEIDQIHEPRRKPRTSDRSSKFQIQPPEFSHGKAQRQITQMSVMMQ